MSMHRGSSMPGSSMQNELNLLTLWPWPLTFEPQNSIASKVSQDDSLHQVLTLWDHLLFSYVADKQTDRQTDGLEILPTPTDIVGVGNKTKKTSWLTPLTFRDLSYTGSPIPVLLQQDSRPRSVAHQQHIEDVTYSPILW